MPRILLAYEAVFPLCTMMVIGAVLMQKHILNEETRGAMNNVAFHVLLPCLIFVNIWSTDLEAVWKPSLIIFELVSFFVMFIALCIVVPRFEKDCRCVPVEIQAIFRSNFVLFGIPITSAVCGAEETGLISMLIAVATPMANILGVVVFCFMLDGKRVNVKQVLKKIATNPLILATILAMTGKLLHIELSRAVLKTLQSISASATPVSLISLGAFLTMGSMKKQLRRIMAVCSARLILIPTIVIALAWMVGLRGTELVSVAAISISPVAVTSFTVAREMGGDADLASQLVASSTGFSVATIFIWIIVLEWLRIC